MYKLLFVMFFVLPSMILCENLEEGPEVCWCIYNGTENPVTFHSSRKHCTIAPKKQIYLDRIVFNDNSPNFGFDLILSSYLYKDKNLDQISAKFIMIQESVDTALCPKKVWRYLERTDGGKQFFNSASWIEGKTERSHDPIFTFSIYPEDFGVDK